MKQKTTESRFEAAEQWLKKYTSIATRISILVLFSICAWRLAWSNITIDLNKFEFSDLLALILALFAVGMSVAFYFKSTDSSNQFYDNSYRFTKEVSEILGRIEAGFGERLRHLDEGYSGLKDRFDQLPYDSQKAQEEIEKEEEELKKVSEERNELINNLAQRAKLQQKEKEELFSQIGQKDEELSKAQAELRFMKRRLANAETKEVIFPDHEIPRGISRYIELEIIDQLDPELLMGAPRSLIRKKIDDLKPKLHEDFLNDAREYGWFDEDGDITTLGIRYLRQLAKNMLTRCGR